MGKAPAEHYISLWRKEAVLVWNYPKLITRKTIMLALIVSIVFGLLMLLEQRSALSIFIVCSVIFLGMLALAMLQQLLLKTDTYRMAIGISNREIGTDGFLWKYTIPWEQISKIHINSAVDIQLPAAGFELWIHLKTHTPRYIDAPKLTPTQHAEFIEILKWHTHKNNIELVLE